MYVVIWEPRSGPGGGHQLVTEYHRADYLQRKLKKALPYHDVRLLAAEQHAAAAVLEREERRQRRRGEGSRS